MEPTYASRKFFQRYYYLSTFIFGYSFATYMSDPNYGSDKFFNNPISKPFPAMVSKEYLSPAEQEAWEYHSPTHTA